ncbi:MAG: glycerophosphodiester phosphodiesterase, partial [Candidatus Doudnabacteria bacterium]|nr:glycerophosphodiester phosphodiesterase [Candidatus Doudnabacteria bacterium]
MIVIGHRGAAGYEPENTLRSFEKAISLGVDMIEFDVRRCKSGELIIIHDDNVDRTTNGKGKVSELNLDTLQQFDAGKGEHIPTLIETLQFINRRVKVDIEIKEENIATDVAKIIDTFISQGWQNSDFLVTSFLETELQAFRKINTQVPIGV